MRGRLGEIMENKGDQRRSGESGGDCGRSEEIRGNFIYGGRGCSTIVHFVVCLRGCDQWNGERG